MEFTSPRALNFLGAPWNSAYDVDVNAETWNSAPINRIFYIEHIDTLYLTLHVSTSLYWPFEIDTASISLSLSLSLSLSPCFSLFLSFCLSLSLAFSLSLLSLYHPLSFSLFICHSSALSISFSGSLCLYLSHTHTSNLALKFS